VHRLTTGNIGALPPDVVDEIVERTDGVPLFVEELTKAVVVADMGNSRRRFTPLGAGPALENPAPGRPLGESVYVATELQSGATCQCPARRRPDHPPCGELRLLPAPQ
jgi:hypothetical protein